MKYLLSNTVKYRVPTVDDVLKLREELENLDNGELVAFSYTTKYVKAKGEIVEEYQVVKAQIDFNDVKEPENSDIDVYYGTGSLTF